MSNILIYVWDLKWIKSMDSIQDVPNVGKRCHGRYEGNKERKEFCWLILCDDLPGQWDAQIFG